MTLTHQVNFTVLQSYAKIKHCVVLAEGEKEEKHLVAYVVPHESYIINASELRDFLKQYLPEFMIPSFFVLLDAIPLTPSGKVDKKELLEKEARYLTATTDYIPARSNEEQILISIWAEVLKRDISSISINDNFFHLGGHSLIATRVISRIRKIFQVELSISDLFEHPTVAGLMDYVNHKQLGKELLPSHPPLALKPLDAPAVLSFAQERLWFLDQLHPLHAFYNIPMAYRIKGAIDLEALEKAFYQLMERHESLRTSFISIEGKPLQQIIPKDKFQFILPIETLLNDAHLTELASQEAQKGFDLSKGPLIRVKLYIIGKEEYLLLITIHHIIADGWSMAIFFQDLKQLYEADIAIKPASLPPLPIQYSDFAYWQRQWLKDEVLEQQLQYWKKQLKDVTTLELPLDNPRPPIQTYNGQTFLANLSPEITQQLKQISQKNHVTLFTTLFSAFSLLLSRYSGQEDITIGTPIAGRNMIELEGLIGFFVNTLVLRSNLSEQPDFLTLLKRNHHMILEAYVHQDVPFEKLVESFELERDPSRNPLFQVMFILQNISESELELPDAEISSLPTGYASAKFDLTLSFAENKEGQLNGLIEYNTNLFNLDTIKRLWEHLVVLLEGIIANPTQAIAEIPMLTAEEQQTLLQWSTSQADPPDKTVFELFEEQVERTPHDIAAICEGETLSYQELNNKANQLAHYLREGFLVDDGSTLPTDTLIAICIEPGLDMLIGIIGILKAGCAYVPIDPSYPAQRIEYMLQDCQAKFLLTHSELIENLKPLAEKLKPSLICILLDTDWPNINEKPTHNPKSISHAKDLAYIIYTSGSTGAPKGVMIPHSALTHYVYWAANHYKVSEGAGSFLHSPIAFDLTITPLFTPLIVGKLVYILSNKQTLAELPAILSEKNLNLIKLTPAHLKLLQEILTPSELAEWGPSIIVTVIGGEALYAEDLSFLRQQENMKFFNEYGPTETTVGCCVYEINSKSPFKGPIPIGKPISNMQLYVLNANKQPTPIGVIGELYIGGAGLALGYLNRPDLTQEKFIRNPFSKDPNSRLYKTGDLVRWLPDGNLIYLGRNDDQVKIRGFRIELGEIEVQLRSYQKIKQCVVLAEGEKENKRLVAYVIPQEEMALDAEELNKFLKERLPEYMVPSAFVLIDSIPLTPNGKIDKKALAEKEARYLTATTHYIAPRSAEEKTLVDIWAQVLKRDPFSISIHDNFFSLGGHSLLATQVVSRIRALFQVELPLAEFFEYPTIAELMEHIHQKEIKLPSYPPLIPRPAEAPLLLSYAQERLWFLDQFQPLHAFYNIPMALRLKGPLNLKALEKALHHLIERHEDLRTTFISIDGKACQNITSKDQFSFKLDLETLTPAADLTEQLKNLASKEAETPFDLSEGPLLRVKLFSIAKNDYLLLITLHHIIADGWSLSIFFQELNELYEMALTQKQNRLPPLPIQYADFVYWQRQWLTGDILEQQLSFWKKQLNGIMPLELPLDFPRPAIQTYNGKTLLVTLSSQLTNQIKELSQKTHVTFFTTLFSAFAILISRYSGQEDLAIGTPIAGRNVVEIESLIGLFLNMLVLRTDLSGQPNFLNILKRNQRMILDAYAHQDIPFEKLVDKLVVDRDPSHSPLFQVIFTLQNTPESVLRLPNIETMPIAIEHSSAKFDLSLAFIEEAGKLNGYIEYNTDLFRSESVERLWQHFVVLLEKLITYPEKPITSFPLLTLKEQQEILIEWNDTEIKYPHKTLKELFEEQVERTPDEIAVIFEESQLSYSELNTKTNQLAHYLREQHQLHYGEPLKPDTLIALCVERSLEMIIGILGILKAGGAYVPIDPNYPTQRIHYMLEDCQPHFLLSQKNLIADSNSILKNLKSHPPYIELDADESSIAKASKENPAHIAGANNLVYVIYTSGSTGQPKGVLIEQSSLINILYTTKSALSIQSTDIFLALASFAFDISCIDFFLPLICGSRCIIASTKTILNAKEIINTINTQHISVMQATPVTWQLLLNEGWENNASMKVISTGEALPSRLAKQLVTENNYTVWNLYGPTETCIWAVGDKARLTDDYPIAPIGKALSNTVIYALDSYMNPVPIAAIGELYIGGAGLARGYLNRPDLSEEKFIKNPFSKDPQSRLYKTGDLVRWLSDGRLEYIGRNDDQVKIRGFRIELGEIEAQLQTYSKIFQCVVMVKNEDQNKRLIAYIVPEQGASLDLSELRYFLKERLPEYMIPHAFAILDKMPLTPNGKIDKKTLAENEDSFLKGHAEYVPPKTGKEKILVKIWADVLKQDVLTLSTHDNFFELGGDSILSLQIIARARQKGLQLTPQQLFTHPTIASLARVANLAPAYIAEQGIVTGEVALTPIQCWFFERITPDYSYFNQAFLYHMHGLLNLNNLYLALIHLFYHHDVLRMCYIQENKIWRQINRGFENDDYKLLYFEKLDLSTFSEDQQKEIIEKHNSECHKKMELAGPLVAACYYDLGNKQHRLLLVIHHLVIDGVSWRILLEDLENIYRQLNQGIKIKNLQLPAKTTSFKDWANQLKQYAQTDFAKLNYEYWLEQVESVAKNAAGFDQNIPVDYPERLNDFENNNQTRNFRKIHIEFSPEESRALLQDVPSIYGTQINDVLLTALILAFHKILKLSSLLIDLEGHGRESILEGIDISRTVGWFTSLFPLYLRLNEKAFVDIGEALKLVKEQLRKIPQKGIGYGILKYLSEDVKLRKTLHEQAKPAIVFNYLGQFDVKENKEILFNLAHEDSGNTQAPEMMNDHLFEINGSILGSQLQFTWAFSERLFDRTHVETLANTFSSYLRGIIKHCQQQEYGEFTPSDFPLIHLDLEQLEKLFSEDLKDWEPKRDIKDLYPLTPLQKGLLFHHLYEPKSESYFIPIHLHLSGVINTHAFHQAWQSLIDQYDVLRTGFVGEELSEPLQFVLKHANLPWKMLDLRHLSEEKRHQAIQNFIDKDRQQRFNFHQPPLMRCTLIQISDTQFLLIWSIHHIIIDGWSVAILLNQFFKYYNQLNTGETISIAYTEPFRNFVAWTQRQDPIAAKTYWKTLLEGFSSPTQIGIRGPKTNQIGHPQKTWYFDKNLTDRIHAFSRENHITISTLFHAVWARLLHCYSNEDDIVFGSTVSGRSADLPEIGQMVGLLINTLPVRSQLSSDQSACEYLQRLQNELVSSRRYEYSALTQIQTWSEVPAGTPLFNSLFVFENYPSEKVTKTDQLQITKTQSFEHTHYELSCIVGLEKNFYITVEYDASFYTQDIIENIFYHFSALTEMIIKNPQKKITEISVLTSEEKRKLLYEWNATEIPFPSEKTIQQLFEEQVTYTPDAIAVICEGKSHTYRELNSKANQLAHYLREQHQFHYNTSLSPDSFIAIASERSFEMIVGFLGILKAGSAYVSIDPNYPSQRIQYILEDSQAKFLILTQHGLIQNLESLTNSKTAPVCIQLDYDWPKIAETSEENLKISIAAENLAYVIYTSGSTGTPKGVMVKHRGVINLLQDFQTRKALSSDDQAGLWSSISFDVSVYEIWSALLYGCTLHIFSDSLRLDPNRLFQYITKNHLNSLYLPPYFISELNKRVLEDKDSFVLKRLLVGTEPISENLLIEIQRKIPGLKIINGYGPTEATICSTLYDISERKSTGHNAPIGRPVQNTKLYILNNFLQLVPIGVVAELFIGGPGVAKGYLNNTNLTQLKFIPNPFDSHSSTKLYRTGDLVKWLPDGNLEFIGRRDDQVKIRGYRIELGEIVAQLKTHPQIHECAVLVKKEKNESLLIAYIEPFKDTVLDPTELRNFLKQRIPDYMIPNVFVMIDAMPLTLTHKIDKKALAQREINYLVSITHYVPPQSSEELALVDIWSEVLQLKPSSIGINDNFFILGGHSLLAIQVISRIRVLFNVELPISVLFDHPTIVGLVEQINLIHKQHERLPEIPPITLKPADAPAVLSFAQERLWFLDQLQPMHAFYNIPIALYLKGPLNTSALEMAFHQLIERHESLRTIFIQVDAKSQQYIIPIDQFEFSFPLEILSTEPVSIEELKVVASQEAQKPFNLSQGPLLRIKLYRIASEEHFLLITLHHIIADGWSIAILSRELSLLYKSKYMRKPFDLPALTIQYVDFAYWQRNWLTEDALKKQIEYWKRKLNNISTIQLPWDFSRPPLQTYKGQTLLASMPQKLTQSLKQLSQKAHVTLFTTLLSSFAVLLYRYSGQDDIAIGSPVAGRNIMELEDLIGLFINTLVLRNDLSGQPNFLTLLQRNHRTTLEAYAHQDIPFEKLVDALEVVRDPSRSPLFQIMFILQNIPVSPWELPDIQITPMEVDYCSAKFDLTLTLSENDAGQINGFFEFNTDLFKPDTIQQLWLHYLVLLEGIVNQPEQSITKLPLLAVDERQILEQWGSCKATYPANKTVPQLFEEQVERTPDHIAVSFKGQSLTYRELNTKANQLAHYLREQYQIQNNQSLTPDTLIAIIADRSIEMMVGVLAILKAGGAYVPIDPQYPAHRIQYTLQDIQAKFLLTQSIFVSNLQTLIEDLEFIPTIVQLDADWDIIDKSSTENLPSIAHPKNLAYVIYTSGSTGTPKGVLIEHYNVARLFSATNDFFHFNDQDVWSLFHSFAFDVSVWEMWGALFYGGKLVIVPYLITRSTEEFYNFIIQEKITVLSQTPTAFKPLIRIDRENKKTNLSLRYIIFAGEKLDFNTLVPWYETHRDDKPKLINMYGITETTVHSTFYAISKSDIQNTTSIIGIPLPDLSMYILDKSLQLLPIGVTGELYVGGAGLARGYLNRPELTQERFIPNPFIKDSDNRLYKSGDLVRWLPDGNLEYIERADDQIKLRGFRIELGEIEAQLLAHPQINQCVVLVKTENGDKHLIAYLISNKGAEIEPLVLRDFLKRDLPDYMIPSAFVILDEMPLTPNGKIDKKVLLESSIEYLHARHKYIYPRNDIEFELIKIWEEILNTKLIGVNDNFFELGGHSLLLIPLISRIDTLFNKKLPISIIFEKPTIREIAETISEGAEIEINPIVNIQTRGNKIPIFCVYPAMGTAFCYLLLSEYLGSDQPFYGIQDPTTGKPTTFASIQEMASFYIEAIKKVQEKGPYILAGWSLGGLIAYEMSQQLIAQGDAVKHLILIDSVTGEQFKSSDEIDVEKLKRDLIEEQIIPPMPKIYDHDKWIDQMVEEIIQRTVLMWKYKPKPYLGEKIALIKADQKKSDLDIVTPSKDNGWSIYAPNLEIYFSSGTHGNMLSEPHVQTLAKIIKLVLCG